MNEAELLRREIDSVLAMTENARAFAKGPFDFPMRAAVEKLAKVTKKLLARIERLERRAA